MCRSNVIIYQNETKFEIYCNDKTESHHIIENILKVAINTITWVWTKSLIIHTVTFRVIVNVEKIYCALFSYDFFSCDFFSCDFFSYLSCDFLSCDFFLLLFLRLPFMYCIYNILFIGRDVRKSNIRFIKISCPPMKRQNIICISDFW
jgi:hypothetical protein